MCALSGGGTSGRRRDSRGRLIGEFSAEERTTSEARGKPGKQEVEEASDVIDKVEVVGLGINTEDPVGNEELDKAADGV